MNSNFYPAYQLRYRITQKSGHPSTITDVFFSQKKSENKVNAQEPGTAPVVLPSCQ